VRASSDSILPPFLGGSWGFLGFVGNPGVPRTQFEADLAPIWNQFGADLELIWGRGIFLGHVVTFQLTLRLKYRPPCRTHASRVWAEPARVTESLRCPRAAYGGVRPARRVVTLQEPFSVMISPLMGFW
jgi:hypothetical protein